MPCATPLPLPALCGEGCAREAPGPLEAGETRAPQRSSSWPVTETRRVAGAEFHTSVNAGCWPRLARPPHVRLQCPPHPPRTRVGGRASGHGLRMMPCKQPKPVELLPSRNRASGFDQLSLSLFSVSYTVDFEVLQVPTSPSPAETHQAKSPKSQMPRKTASVQSGHCLIMSCVAVCLAGQ